MKISFILFLTVLFWSCSSLAAGIPGINGPRISFEEGKIILKMDLTEIDFESTLEVKVPQTENSSVTFSDDGTQGSQVTVKFDVNELNTVMNVEEGEVQALPCGRPIPGGTLKDAVRVDLPEDNYGLSFYFHKNLFGTYIPFNFDFPEGSAMIPLKWKGSNIGAISVIGKDGNKKASGTIFLNMRVIKAHKEIQKLLK